MKLGSLITVMAFVASSSAWAAVDPPFSVNKVEKLDNTVGTVDGKKIKGNKTNVDDIGSLMCGRVLIKGEAVVAVMPCDVDRLPAEGFELAVYNDSTGSVSDCERIPVEVGDYLAAGDGTNTTQISAIVRINKTFIGSATTLDWSATALIDASIVKKSKTTLDGLNCVKKASSKTGTGSLDGSPISKVKLKIGKVQGGTSVIIQ
jgi:hypothetical protein